MVDIEISSGFLIKIKLKISNNILSTKIFKINSALACGIPQFNQVIILLFSAVPFNKVVDDPVSEAILNEYFFFVRVRSAVGIHFVEAGFGTEVDFEDNGVQDAAVLVHVLLPRNISAQSKFHCHLLDLTSTCIASQTNFLADCEGIKLLQRHLESSVKGVPGRQPVFRSFVLICVDDYAAEGCCESAVGVDLGFILVSNDAVEVSVDKRLHRVDVEELLRDFMVGV